MERKNTYDSPQIDILKTNVDLITFSETEEWTGPEIDANTKTQIGIEN